MTEDASLLPLTGYIDHCWTREKRQKVEGFAFQVPGFEFLRTWATPSQKPADAGKWHVSHWDSGLSIGADDGVVGDTPQEAARKVEEFLRGKGVERIRERLKQLGWDA